MEGAPDGNIRQAERKDMKEQRTLDIVVSSHGTTASSRVMRTRIDHPEAPAFKLIFKKAKINKK